MSIFNSKFLTKGAKNGNTYYVASKTEGKYNVYQLYADRNNNIDAEFIKQMLPSFKKLADDELIIDIPNEEHKAFLLMKDISIQRQQLFRTEFDKGSEEIIIYSQEGDLL